VFAIGVHTAIIGAVLWIPGRVVEAALPNALSVVMVEQPSEEPNSDAESEPEEPALVPAPEPRKPEFKPEPILEPEIIPEVTIEDLPGPTGQPETEDSQTPITILQSDELTQTPGEGAPAISHIPSRWALKPPLAPERLEGLGFSQDDIECLTSLKEDCTALRKEVFAEYRLTATELVWTPDRADTGLPVEFRGLSEIEILEKLGTNYAGGNALVLLPGITIDGPLWDKLHGVNKTCKLRQSYGSVQDGTAGKLEVRRDCD